MYSEGDPFRVSALLRPEMLRNGNSPFAGQMRVERSHYVTTLTQQFDNGDEGLLQEAEIELSTLSDFDYYQFATLQTSEFSARKHASIYSIKTMRWRTEIRNGIRNEVNMNNSVKWSWFKVHVKVKKGDLFLRHYKVK
jgi:hypothetical protein